MAGKLTDLLFEDLLQLYLLKSDNSKKLQLLVKTLSSIGFTQIESTLIPGLVSQ